MDTLELIFQLKKEAKSYNPFLICEALNIDIKYVPFLDNPKGQFQKILNQKVILLSDDLKESQERFYICAHELGHAVLHRDTSNYYVSNQKARSKSESEANRFATSLILNLYKEDLGVYPREFKTLQLHYGVPSKSERFLFE
ncbi:hypothetical protein RV11_GL003469 [Enterococcus phoeniculicola]|uniref:IrrE N-terminal-like domain-containing protein n=1 Tax=Enterococcus phoeniculicola ATCC BAA-412 TaxID=1158610 RepID=R3TKT8_9ENTE|nr:ImmA/IrrE family metallo-endopeptidase [Enterococcus phoeniculicola]EOL42039.1 hypothetical protein UC3_02387 [Enterococcus phoeniculicola ATCC BAA-412]EOT79682.1 hypothetical protein I589_01194 [Enterococcus phoeniculicola ATCC BAA-412]OJG71748.1 hypothetical protein RV11_GL003469 [Enterococcus phoeniculicola]